MKKLFILLFILASCGATGHSQTIVGDVNGDGVVTANDVTMVYDIILGNLAKMTKYEVNGVEFVMCEITGGTFIMGANDDDNQAEDNEKPAHQVTLSNFSICQTEVTQDLWIAVMSNNPSRFNGGIYGYDLNRPVENVSWDDCQEFISKLNQITGKTFRLPTEAEWEFAARGGNKSQGFKYSGNNNIDLVAWFMENSNNRTQPVATKRPNELELYDMSGNVYEWCQDWYDSSYYSISPSDNPIGPETGTRRVWRGGAWNDNSNQCRVTYRNWGPPEDSASGGILGFRLAMSVEK